MTDPLSPEAAAMRGASAPRVRLSAYLITLNEQERLDEVLTALRGVDEIVVVDSGSTDATLEIARRHGARVVHQDWLGFARQKDFAMRQCTGDWALALDGDEVFPPGSIQQMREAIATHDVDAFYFGRVEVFMGQPLWRARCDRFLRLHRRGVAHWTLSRRVHEHIDVHGKVHHLDLRFVHYGYDGIDRLLRKFATYARLKALQKADRGQRPSVVRALLAPGLYLVKYLVVRRCVLAGIPGFGYAAMQGIYALLCELYMFEQRGGVAPDATPRADAPENGR